MNKKTYIIPGKEKDILADLTYSENNPSPLVIFCHGYKGYKDWGAWNLVANEFAKEGISFLKFNFSHNGGTIDNPIDFPDLEAFGNNTYSKECSDLEQVIDWVLKNDSLTGLVNTNQINLIGHSRGGGIITLVGERNKNVATVISWAGVADYKRRFPVGDQLEQWRQDGVYYVVNGRTKQSMPHYYSFYEDFVANESKLDILAAAKRIDKPHFIVHGTNDEAVNVSEAKELREASSQAELVLIEQAGHTFGAKHPWEMNVLPRDMKKVVDLSIDFIKRQLSK